MKRILFFCIALLVCVKSNAQKTEGDNADKISLSAYIPDQIDHDIPDGARNLLENKLNQLITQNGVHGGDLNQRFIITAHVVTVSKNITPTAPALVSLSLDVNLYIGDGIDGIKFASTSVSVKGVGDTETKAYISAFGRLSASNAAVSSFIQSGKTKILQYYNTRCANIIKDAERLTATGAYDAALYSLTGVPEASNCYDKAMALVVPIYKKSIEKDCQLKLASARNQWAANQNVSTANTIAASLSTVDPASPCFSEVKTFMTTVAKRVKELDQREWTYILKEQQRESEIIKAARDIGVAYGNNQPKSISYNVHGWW